MENKEQYANHPPVKDKTYRMPFSYWLIRLWSLRVILYMLLWVSAVFYFYQEFVSNPLEAIKRFNISDTHFIWRTFNEGIGVAAMMCYLLLIILFLIEFTLCQFYCLYGTEDDKWVIVSKRIHIGIIIAAALMTCFLPFLLK